MARGYNFEAAIQSADSTDCTRDIIEGTVQMAASAYMVGLGGRSVAGPTHGLRMRPEPLQDDLKVLAALLKMELKFLKDVLSQQRSHVERAVQ